MNLLYTLDIDIFHLQHRIEASGRTLCGSRGDWNDTAFKVAGARPILYIEVELCTKGIDGRYGSLETLPALYFLGVSGVPDVQPIRGGYQGTWSGEIWHHLTAIACGRIKH